MCSHHCTVVDWKTGVSCCRYLLSLSRLRASQLSKPLSNVGRVPPQSLPPSAATGFVRASGVSPALSQRHWAAPGRPSSAKYCGKKGVFPAVSFFSF